MRGFVSYAHQRSGMFEQFNKFSKLPLASIDGLKVWTDNDNRIGDEFERRILDQIQVADLFILLVCADFLASDFIIDKELPAIQRRLVDGALVLPVVLRPCQWQYVLGSRLAAPLGNLNRIVPVSDWRPHDNGYNRAIEQVMASICQHFGVTPNQNRLVL